MDYWEETAVEIAKGVCEYTGVAYVEAKDNETDTLYKVQIGAFKNKSNADRMLVKAKAAGFTDAFIQVH